METSLIEFEEKAKEEMTKKLETAEINREKVIQVKLDSLKKHVKQIILKFISCNEIPKLNWVNIICQQEEKVEQLRNLKRNSSVMDDSSVVENVENGAGDNVSAVNVAAAN